MTPSTPSPVATGSEVSFEVLSITPEPTADERAAIISAVERLQAQLWPSGDTANPPAPSPRWRYAGRRWNRRSSYGGWN